jgi:hypothetical protein
LWLSDLTLVFKGAFYCRREFFYNIDFRTKVSVPKIKQGGDIRIVQIPKAERDYLDDLNEFANLIKGENRKSDKVSKSQPKNDISRAREVTRISREPNYRDSLQDFENLKQKCNFRGHNELPQSRERGECYHCHDERFVDDEELHYDRQRHNQQHRFSNFERCQCYKTFYLRY